MGVGPPRFLLTVWFQIASRRHTRCFCACPARRSAHATTCRAPWQKKVLVHDRRTIEVWYGSPNPQRFENWDKWLPACNSSRRGRPAWAEPEIWFRIVHIALDVQDANCVATYLEQAVEIALGPKGAFENGNIGSLTRRVPANRVVSAVSPREGKPKPPREPKTPRVVELLRRAVEWQVMLGSGDLKNQAEIARREGLTRARVIQVVAMLRLAPEI